MSRTSNTPLLLVLVICILMMAGAIVAAVFLAGRKPLVVVVPSSPQAGDSTAAVAETTPAASEPASAVPAAKPPEISIVRLPSVPALQDVFDPAWDKAPTVQVPLQPQQTADPMLASATIPAINVQAARDDKRIAWRLSWPATQPTTLSETGHFPDAAAIQIPMIDGAPFTMGAKGMPVRLLYWKSLWQKDLDEGFQDINKLYPNAWNDLYWFMGNKDESGKMKDGKNAASSILSSLSAQAQQYFIALAAGNPMASLDRAQPVEEIIAEGFGTATHVPDSPSHAKGVWRQGQWTVVIDRPLDSQDPFVARLQSSAANLVAFAVWDGAAANRGGRKHYCSWIAMRIEP